MMEDFDCSDSDSDSDSSSDSDSDSESDSDDEGVWEKIFGKPDWEDEEDEADEGHGWRNHKHDGDRRHHKHDGDRRHKRGDDEWYINEDGDWENMNGEVWDSDEDWENVIEYRPDFSELKENFLGFMEPLYEKVEPLFYVARTLALEYTELKTTTLMTIFLKAPMLLHEKHHAMCESVVDLNEEPCPIKRHLCSENGKMVANYAAFLTTLPALKAH